jgi:hypothetical protein
LRCSASTPRVSYGKRSIRSEAKRNSEALTETGAVGDVDEAYAAISGAEMPKMRCADASR